MKKAVQHGFTLIELIVVIVILGFLAATALPKFIDLRSDASGAALQGVVGAAAAAHTVNYGGCSVKNNVPTAAATNPKVCVTINNCSQTDTILQGGLPTGYTIASLALGTAAVGSNGVSASCVVTQTATGNTASFQGISAGN